MWQLGMEDTEPSLELLCSEGSEGLTRLVHSLWETVERVWMKRSVVLTRTEPGGGHG